MREKSAEGCRRDALSWRGYPLWARSRRYVAGNGMAALEGVNVESCRSLSFKRPALKCFVPDREGASRDMAKVGLTPYGSLCRLLSI